MSTTFHETAKALQADPELKTKVLSATSAEERASILRDAGVAVPSQSDINATHSDLEGITGGNTTSDVVAAAPAAAAGAAA